MDTPERAAAAAPGAGIAVRKTALDVALRPGGEAWRCAHDEAGSGEVVSRLKALAPHVIVLEATGGLERLLVAALALAGLPLAVVTPRQVRACAQATGQWATTDALDAAVLAHFAAAIHPTPRPLPDAQNQALAAVVERRRQVVGMLRAEQHRFPQALPTVRPQVATHSAWLEQARDEWDGEVDQTRRTSPLWRERDHLQRATAGGGSDGRADAARPPARVGPGLSEARGYLGRLGPARAAPAAPGAAPVLAGAAGGRCGRRSTWPPWWACATPRSCAPALRSGSRAAHPSRWP